MRIVTDNVKDKQEKKRIVITHDDADGLMSAVVLQKFGKVEDGRWGVIASASPTTHETDAMLQRADSIWGVSQGDTIFIVDREMLSEKMQKRFKGIDIVYIDHHLTNKNNDFGSDVTFIWDENESGATLSLKYFKLFPQKMKEISKEKLEGIERIAQSVRLWDIFKWTELNISIPEEKILYEGAFEINSLEKIFGRKYFYKMMMEDSIETIEKKSKMAYEIFSNEYEEYKVSGTPYRKEFQYMGHKIRIYCGFDFRFQSLYSYELFKNTDLDAVIYVNLDGSVSIRNRIGTDSTYLASELGRLSGFSGGGHKNATGCRIMDFDRIREFLVNSIIDSIKKMDDFKL